MVRLPSGEAVNVQLESTGVLQAAISAEQNLTGVLSIAGATYTGDVDFTPQENKQVVYCAGRVMSQNIVIEPIPSNYGKIAWDGVSLHVS